MGLDALIDWPIVKFRMKPKNIEQLMLPITIIGWMIGRGIIEFPLGRRWPVTSGIYSFFIIFGYCAVTKIMIENADNVLLSTSEVGSLLVKMALFMNTFVIIWNTLSGWKNGKSVKNIIKSLGASSKKMEQLAIPEDYKSLYKRHIVGIICETIFFTSGVVILYSCNPPNREELEYRIAVSVSLLYPLIVFVIGDAAFIILVRSLSFRFEQLNKALKQMSTTTDNSPQHKRVLDLTISKRPNVDDVFEKRTNDDSNLMRLALEAHYELVRIGSLINDTFGAQAFISITFGFSMLIGMLYRSSALLLWSTSNRNLVDGEVLNLLHWVVFCSYRIFKITSACTKTSNKCKETAVIICQLHEPSTSKTFRDQISDFTLQISQHTVEFTACGLFPLDNSLIHAMIGSISTYLVILVQIGDTSTSELLATSETPTSKPESWL